MVLTKLLSRVRLSIAFIYMFSFLALGLLTSMISSYLGFIGEDNPFSSIVRKWIVLLAFICILMSVHRRIYLEFLTKEAFFVLLIYVYYIFIVNYDLNYTVNSGVVFTSHEKKQILTRMMRLVFFPMLAGLVFRIKGLNLIRLAKAVFWSIFVSMLLAMLVMNIGLGQVVDERLEVEGELNSLNMGYWAAALFLLSMFLIIKTENKTKYIYGFLGGVLSLYVMIIAGSRGPVFYSFIIFYYYLMNTNFSLKLKRVVIFFSLLSLLVIFVDYSVLTDLIGIYNPHLEERLIASIETQESSGRDSIYKIAFNQFLTRPLIGDYFVLRSGEWKGHYPHNIILEALMTFGLVGSIPLFILFYKTMKRVHLLVKINDERTWLALFFLLFFAKGLSTWSLYGNSILWMSMFIILSYKYSNLRYEYIFKKKQ